MSQSRQPGAVKRHWWPLFSGQKAIVGQESVFGWFDDLRISAMTPDEYRAWRAAPAGSQPAPVIAAKPTPLPAPEPEPAPATEMLARAAEPAAPIADWPHTASDHAEPAPPHAPEAEPAFEPGHEPLGPVADLPHVGAPKPARAPNVEPVAVPELAIESEIAAPAPELVQPKAPAEPPRETLWSRLRSGLKRSADSLGTGIGAIFGTGKIDEASLEELEDLLISSDLGISMATRLTDTLRDTKIDKAVSGGEIRAMLAEEVLSILQPAERPLEIDPDRKPHVVLVVGVNGTGKTTTIGKLAHKLKADGKSVMMAAGDTFRAAAIEQLKVWGERTGAEVVARDVGADAAGLAFDALERAKAEGIDVLLVDTAGRLQNKAELMAELEKVIRVLRKIDPSAPHSVVQVLDATTGQNAIAQVEAFQRTAGVTGLVMTKLDGTARGGILVPLTEKFGLPIHAIGVGEAVEDLQAFQAALFAKALAGAEETSAAA